MIRRLSYLEQAIRALAAALFAFGCTMMLETGFDLGGAWTNVMVTTLAIVAILALFAVRAKVLWIGLGVALGAAALFLWRFSPDTLGRILADASGVVQWLLGGAAPSTAAFRRLDIPLALFFALLAFPLFRLRVGTFPALSLLGLLTGTFWFLGDAEKVLPWTLPCVLAILLLFGLGHIDAQRIERNLFSRLSIGAVALVSVAIAIAAWALLPQQPPRWNALTEGIQHIVDRWNNQPDMSLPRTPYNSRMAGLQPLGARLGGPVAPSSATVMRVSGGPPTLLRGTMRNAYDGATWKDTLQSRRYPYDGVALNANIKRAFDQDLPLRLSTAEKADLFRTNTYTIELVDAGSSTLFAPQRVDGFRSSAGLDVFYNLSGELFLLENVPNDSPYEITTRTLNRGSATFASVVERAGTQADANIAQVLADYIQLPEGIDAEVGELARTITRDVDTAYAKASAIEDYLRNHFTYTLKPAIPPADADFVSYFLLESQEGYCTYFASAMAILAREIGLPSRYVEGYSMNTPPEGDVYELSSKNAHAWVEIYFQGFGWLPFDPTPGGGSPDQTSEDSTVTPPPEADASPDPSETAGTTFAPTETPPPEDITPEPEDGTPDPTPEPEEDPPAPTPPGQTPPPEDMPEDPPVEPFELPAWAIGILIALAAAGLVALWFRATFPRFHRRWLDSRGMALRIYNDMLHIAKAAGVPLSPSETLHAHAVRVDEKLSLFDDAMTTAADLISGMTFAGKEADEATVEALHTSFRELVRAVRCAHNDAWFFLMHLRVPPLPKIKPPT